MLLSRWLIGLRLTAFFLGFETSATKVPHPSLVEELGGWHEEGGALDKSGPVCVCQQHSKMVFPESLGCTRVLHAAVSHLLIAVTEVQTQTVGGSPPQPVLWPRCFHLVFSHWSLGALMSLWELAGAGFQLHPQGQPGLQPHVSCSPRTEIGH